MLETECLEKQNAKKINSWPEISDQLIVDDKIKIAIQINGKTREIMETKKDLDEKNVIIESKKIQKIHDNLKNKNIIKIIFVKNRIINYLVK